MGLDDAVPAIRDSKGGGMNVSINDLDNKGDKPTPPEVITGKTGKAGK